ncbi:hypothetical protein, partial [Shewanella hanedai]|uniref:hypothetical protein n=1 Tax=Shewanella hanedai TaxID=25 RepID=UPI001E2C1CB1
LLIRMSLVRVQSGEPISLKEYEPFPVYTLSVIPHKIETPSYSQARNKLITFKIPLSIFFR